MATCSLDVLDDRKDGLARSEVGGNLARKQFPRSLPSRAVALRAAGNEVIRIIGTAGGIGPKMVKRKLDALLYSVATVAASQPVAEVEGQSFLRAYPVHALIPFPPIGFLFDHLDYSIGTPNRNVKSCQDLFYLSTLSTV